MEGCNGAPTSLTEILYVGVPVIFRDTSTRTEEDADVVIKHIIKLDWSQVPENIHSLPED